MDDLFQGPHAFGAVDLDAYCARIGYCGSLAPTLATLRDLHRLHPAAIPFETIDVRLGLGVRLDDAALDAKLLGSGRGGYCFEQNVLFLRVLRTLGFEAEPLLARSRWGRAAGELNPRTHMALRVRLDGVDWLADVGFGGCMLTAPIRMDVSAPQETRHEPARLVSDGDGLAMTRLIGDAWTPICDLLLARQEPVDVMAANWLISQHPGSHFRHRLLVSRTRDEVRHVLVDGRLTVRRADRVERRDLSADELERALADDFGLDPNPAWRPLIEQVTPPT